MWQECVISVVTLALTASLLPMLRDADARIPMGTSLVTALGLFVKTLMFTSLGMGYAALGVGVGFVLWSVILYTKSGGRELLADRLAPTQVAAARADYSVADD